jgi:amino acid permease
VGDILNEGVQAMGLASDNKENSRQQIMISFWVLVMFPLSLQRHMGALERFSSLGVLSILSLVFAAVLHSLIHNRSFGGDGDTQQQQQQPNRTSISSMLWPDSFWDIIKACPIIIFAFSCQINVCAIYEELTPSNTESGLMSRTIPMLKSKQCAMKKITRNSVFLCMSLYICIGLFGFLDFGHDTSDNILNNYCIQKTHDPMIIVPSAFFAVAIVIAFPFNIFPARVTMKLILERVRRRRRCGRCHRFFSSITCENCLLPWSGSKENSRVGRGLESLVDSGNEHAIATDPLLGDDRFGDKPILIPHMSLEAAASDKEDGFSEESPPLEHFLLTLMLAGSALIVALLVPGLSIVFGIMGGSAASVIAFILPGMFLKEAIGSSTVRDVGASPIRVLPFLLVWGGTLVGVLSTGITIFDLFLPRNGAGENTCRNHNTTDAST